MADLKDVVDSLTGVNNTLKKSVKNAAKEKEAAAEARREAKASTKIQRDILKTLRGASGAASTGDKKKGGLIAGLLGGLGAGIGGIARGISKITPMFVTGMTSLGLGIVGFLGGLGGGAAVAKYLGIDGDDLGKLVSNTFGAFDNKSLKTMGLVMAGAIAMKLTKTSYTAVIGGMGAIGVGVTAFMAGILLGDALSEMAKMIKLDGSSLNTLITNFTTAFTGTDGAGLDALGVLLFSAVGLGFVKGAAANLVYGMAAIGAGISAFMGGILLGDAVAKLSVKALGGVAGEGLKNLITNFTTGFSGTDGAGLEALGALLVGAVGLGFVKGAAANLVYGMAAIGAGISAFMGGILLGDAVAKVGSIYGIDGGNIKKLMTNFSTGLAGFDGDGLKALGGLIVTGAAIGVTGTTGAVILGMGAIGAGIAAFMGGLLLTDWLASLGGDNAGASLKILLTNIGESIGGFLGGITKGTADALKTVDSDRLIALGEGIKNIGIGMRTAAGGVAVGFFAGMLDALGSFFGLKSPLERIIEISQDKSIDSKRLKELGEGIGPLGQGLAGFSGIDFGGGVLDKVTGGTLEEFIKTIARIGTAEINIDADRLKTVGNALLPLSKGIAGFANIDMGKIVSSDVKGEGTDLERFFRILSADNLDNIVDETTAKQVAAGITPLAESMKSFVGLDMAAIVGNNWTPGKDTALETFFKVLPSVSNIKDPKKLQHAAIGIKALGEAMQSFRGLDSGKMNFEAFFDSLDDGNPERMKKNLAILVEATGGSAKAQGLLATSGENAMSVSGGTVTVNNYYNTDNSSRVDSKQIINASGEDVFQREGTYTAVRDSIN